MYLVYLMILLLCLHGICSESPQSSCKTISINSNLRTEQNPDASPIDVVFQNHGNAQLEILWLSASGVENSMGVLEPHDELSFSSYTGHAFRLRLLSTSDAIFEVVVMEKSTSVTYEVGRGCSEESTTFEDLSIRPEDYKFHSQKTITMIPNVEEVQKAIRLSQCQNIGLSDWISREVTVPGYHVLCFSPTSDGGAQNNGEWTVDIEAWKDGHDPINHRTRQTFTGSRYLQAPTYPFFLRLSCVFSVRCLAWSRYGDTWRICWIFLSPTPS